MMSLEEVNTKFKPEFKMPEITLTKNLLKDNKLLKCKFNNKDQLSVPHTFLRVKIDKILHLENHTTSKIDELLDRKIMTCKTAEVEAISNKENSDR